MEGPQGQGERLQVARVGLTGDVPRRRPVLRPEGQGADRGLGLDLKHVVAGAEPAQVARWSQLYKQKKPVLFYWYDPQYLNAQYDLVKVKLPARTKSCQDDEKKGGDPKKYACDYPSYRLDKIISGKFAKSGSPAVAVVKRFKWTSRTRTPSRT